MNKCPSCNEMTITNYQKVNLGPLTEVECPNCNANISMPWIALLYKLGYFALMIICIFYFDFELFEFVAFLLGVMGLDSYTRFKFVPLIIKK